MNMPLLATSVLCQRLNFTNFGDVGTCLVESVFYGDIAIAGIILFVMFTALIVRYNFPITIILPVGLALAYVLWLMSGAEIFMGVLLLALIVGGAILIIALINYLNR